ncbi:hypothetical protein LUZ60_007455 [Juncus effusus]|nr:hypothetical protein LUZ60_007455 [Juncus effusus]
MGKGLTSLLSCKYPKTTSFRAGTDTETIYKTMNSVYLDNIYSEEEEEEEEQEQEQTDTDQSTSTIDEPEEEETLIETLVVHQLHSDRLLFEPTSTTCSILERETENKKENDVAPFKESFVLAMESTDPYTDFRSSMEEMVVAYGLKDWNRLEELLTWYLRVNGKKNHGFIIGAFVDLLVGLIPVPVGVSSEESTSYSNSNSSCITSVEIEGSE